MYYEVRTFEDIYKSVLEELKVPTSDTTTLNRIKRDINMHYIALVAKENWKWSRIEKDITAKAYYNTGTIAVTNNDRTITFSSAPVESKKNHYFFIEGYSEIYKIESHVAGASSAELESEFTGTTNAAVGFKVFTNEIALPTNMNNVHAASIDHRGGSMDAIEDKEYTKIFRQAPYFESRPEYYTLTDYIDADEYSAISGLPATASRQSSGTLRTIIFATSVADYISEGDTIKVASAGQEAYNITEAIVESISTTTIKYLTTEELYEANTVDTSISIELKNDSNAHRRQLKLRVYPAVNDEATTIHVEGSRRPSPLENNDDEPILPVEYRSMLVYQTLEKAWRRHRNPEESATNRKLYKDMYKQMRGKHGPGKDAGKMSVSKFYLRGKRLTSNRGNKWWRF